MVVDSEDGAGLLSHNNPSTADIPLRIKYTKRHDIFTCGLDWNINRVTLAWSVGDPVIGVDGSPLAAVHAKVGTV